MTKLLNPQKNFNPRGLINDGDALGKGLALSEGDVDSRNLEIDQLMTHIRLLLRQANLRGRALRSDEMLGCFVTKGQATVDDLLRNRPKSINLGAFSEMINASSHVRGIDIPVAIVQSGTTDVVFNPQASCAVLAYVINVGQLNADQNGRNFVFSSYRAAIDARNGFSPNGALVVNSSDRYSILFERDSSSTLILYVPSFAAQDPKVTAATEYSVTAGGKRSVLTFTTESETQYPLLPDVFGNANPDQTGLQVVLNFVGTAPYKLRYFIPGITDTAVTITDSLANILATLTTALTGIAVLTTPTATSIQIDFNQGEWGTFESVDGPAQFTVTPKYGVMATDQAYGISRLPLIHASGGFYPYGARVFQFPEGLTQQVTVKAITAYDESAVDTLLALMNAFAKKTQMM